MYLIGRASIMLPSHCELLYNPIRFMSILIKIKLCEYDIWKEII